MFAKIAYGVVGIAIVLVIYISYLIFFPNQVLKVNHTPLPADPTVVHAGEVITTTLDYCKYQDVASRITIDFEGEFVVPQLSTVQHFPVGCNIRKLPFTVPFSVKPGEYRVLITITYRVNSLNVQSYEFYSVPITVLEAKLPIE